MKKLFATLLLGSMMAAAALAVSAEEGGAVVLTPSTDGAQVSLNLPSDTTQDITTMRLSLTVTSSDPLNAQFVFDDAIESSVREYRYDADSGRLNVYLSGRSTLFADGALDLGQVQLTTRDGKPAQATLTVGEDAVQLVNAAFGTPDRPEITQVSTEVTVGGDTDKPSGGDSSGDSTQKPDSNPGGSTNNNAGNPGSSGSGSSNSQSATAQGEETVNPAATPAPTAAPAAPNAGTSSQSLNGGKGTAAPTATPAPEATATPTATPAAQEAGGESDAAPDTQPEASATPEQTGEEEKAAFPLGLGLVLGAAVILAAGAGAVILLRRRG